jgi:glycosyltransferase involved in cell wall biosynthesis
MRILHVVFSLVPGEYWGGISKLVYELGVAQAAEGHDVTIYTTDLLEGRRILPRHGEIREGLRIEYFRGVRFPRFGSPDMKQAMLANRGNFDVVHSHNNFLSFNVYVREVFGGRVSVFYQAHGSLDPVVVNKGLMKSVKKRLYIHSVEFRNLSVAAGMFASTEVEESQLRQLGVTCPIKVLGNGINEVRVSGLAAIEFRRRFGIRESRLIVYVGRIHWKKGIDRLLRAFQIFARQHADVGLVIGGVLSQHGSYGATLQALAKDLQIENRVYWPGFVDEELKTGIFAAASLFSHVSDSEGMAMAVLEAMSAGLPTIVGTGCYMHEAALAGAVFEIEPTVESLADALERLTAEKDLADRIGARAREYTLQCHSWRDIARSAVEFYTKQI